jgi:hypothetical protein
MLGEHTGREVGDCDTCRVGSDSDTDRGAGARVEAQQHGGTPDGSPGPIGFVFDDEPLILERVDDARHGGPREAGKADEVGPARRALTPQGIEDPEAIVATWTTQGA